MKQTQQMQATETHHIEYDLPMGLGKVKADVRLTPANDEEINVYVLVKHVPQLFKVLVGKYIGKPINRLVKRSFFRETGEKMIILANTPANENKVQDTEGMRHE